MKLVTHIARLGVTPHPEITVREVEHREDGECPGAQGDSQPLLGHPANAAIRRGLPGPGRPGTPDRNAAGGDGNGSVIRHQPMIPHDCGESVWMV